MLWKQSEKMFIGNRKINGTITRKMFIPLKELNILVTESTPGILFVTYESQWKMWLHIFYTLDFIKEISEKYLYMATIGIILLIITIPVLYLHIFNSPPHTYTKRHALSEITVLYYFLNNSH